VPVLYVNVAENLFEQLEGLRRGIPFGRRETGAFHPDSLAAEIGPLCRREGLYAVPAEGKVF
jgi:hypothetical protein